MKAISELRTWIGNAIWNPNGAYRAPSIADAHQWHKKARQAERQIAALEQRQAKLEAALEDIARGNAAVPDEILEQGRAALTSYMWTYSQKRALAATQEQEDESGPRQDMERRMYEEAEQEDE